MDEADRAIRKAIELQPEAGWERVQLVIIRIQRGDIEGAKSATNDVHEEGGWRDVAQAFLQQAAGSRAEADAALNLLIRTQAELSAFQIAEVYAMRGDADNTFHWLEQAWGNRDPGLSRLWFDPFILRYKHDERFITFCQHAGLPANGEGGEPAIATPATPATPHAAAVAQGKAAP